MSISAPYWLVNRTGLPLVFRAEGGSGEAAGQFAEHEVARMVAPLLFSFAEAEGGPTLAARLGQALAPRAALEWCSPFGLGPGIAVKKLEARADGEPSAGGGERVYAVGVSVRAGRARYRHTNIVTFTPRYQLHNNTRHHLQFAQRCTATTLSDPGATATHVSAVAGCYLPWHWARWDRDHLLCVRVLASGGAPGTAWSGGFRLDAPRSLTVACREPAGHYQFVRVEVAAQGATLFVVFTDAESAPPPLVIHNYSPVSIMFHQVSCLFYLELDFLSCLTRSSQMNRLQPVNIYRWGVRRSALWERTGRLGGRCRSQKARQHWRCVRRAGRALHCRSPR